jgi:hypothetical protein
MMGVATILIPSAVIANSEISATTVVAVEAACRRVEKGEEARAAGSRFDARWNGPGTLLIRENNIRGQISEKVARASGV